MPVGDAPREGFEPLEAAILPGWNEHAVLRRFRDDSAEILLVLDPVGRIVWADPAARRALAIGERLRPELTIFASLEAPDFEVLLESLGRLRAASAARAVESCELEHRVRGRKSARIRWCVRALHGRDGRAVGFSCTGVDVTAQRDAASELRRSGARATELEIATRALEESERRFHAVFENTFEMIGVLSPDGVVLEMNRTALRAIGARREDVVGVPFPETNWWSHSHEQQVRVRQAIATARRGGFARFEAQSVGRDGSVRDIDFSLQAVRDDDGEVVLLIPEGRDVSELKRAQRAEVAMLRAFAAIGESAALLAHEIKNPITAVHVALRAVATELGADHRVILEDLVARMQRIESMMRRTLSLTKPLDLRSKECSAELLFADVRSQLHDRIARARADVRVETPTGDVLFRADRQLLHDVLANLVTNAIEARPLGASVVLRATSDADGAAILSVEDDGPGIPGSLVDSLFRPFVTTKPKGTGLGLSICKKIVEEHGGTIALDRDRARGTRFEIRLPTGTRP